MSFCREPLNDISVMDGRIRAFLENRYTEAITGPRRYGRTEFVGLVASTARGMGLLVSTEQDQSDGAQIIILDHWNDLGSVRELISRNPQADVMYGQDLCHQVPAVVRMNPPRMFSDRIRY